LGIGGAIDEADELATVLAISVVGIDRATGDLLTVQPTPQSNTEMQAAGSAIEMALVSAASTGCATRAPSDWHRHGPIKAFSARLFGSFPIRQVANPVP